MRSVLSVLAVLVGCADSTPPEIIVFTPSVDADLRGAGLVQIRATVADVDTITAEAVVDGVSLGEIQESSCEDSGCDFAWEWDSSDVPVGPHEIALVARDASDNGIREVHPVMIDDIVTITAMRVTEPNDEILEIEVYVFDKTDRLVGCAGSRQGLAAVDEAGVLYPVKASLIDRELFHMSPAALGDRPVRFEIWEDDDGPVCPTVPDPSGNDLVAASPHKPASEWKTTASIVLRTAELRFEFERPLTLHDDAPQTIPDDDPPYTPDPPGPLFDRDGAGCTAGGPAGLGLGLLGLFGIRRRRRR
jgi:MYXO-CTERM domain-containing protein